jgi:pimeloyl-ACP methyl ester carboxylesterase
MASGEQNGTVERDGATIAWLAAGSGPPLLLINGYAATAADWDPTFLLGLARRRRVICVDNRGMGGSTLGDDELSVATMASDAVAVLDSLEIGSAPVAGWSMGSFVAQQLAASAPERVERLILLAADPGGPEAQLPRAADWAALTDRSGSPREQATRLLGLLFPAPLAAELDEQFGELVARARAELSPAALDAQELAMAAWHREPADARLAAIAAPTVLAFGTEDVLIPPANSTLLAARLADASAHAFAGGGHAFMAQEPHRLARLIGEFLN